MIRSGRSLATDFELLAHLAEVLRQVVGEGIVVVEEQNHFTILLLRLPWAISSATTRARDLLTVS